MSSVEAKPSLITKQKNRYLVVLGNGSALLYLLHPCSRKSAIFNADSDRLNPQND
jgi:hypothetical protein